jgi:muconolactone delta-isomerase
MTTHVPDGTPVEAVDEVRAREAGHSRDLAAEKYLLRLWRPPLGPGEWRSLGLFAAEDPAQLEQVLQSMPLRIWRSDEVTTLSPHPNEPARAGGGKTTEFLTRFVVEIPETVPGREFAAAEVREAEVAKDLGHRGHLERLWGLPEPGQTLGLWRAKGESELRAIVASLPLDPWMTTTITQLTPHPSDPMASGS